MKLRTLALVCALGAGFFSGSPARADESKHVSVRTERFSGKTRVWMGAFETANSFKELHGCFSCSLGGLYLPEVPGSVALILYYNGRQWAFLKNHEAFMLLDGERFALDSTHGGDVNWDAVSWDIVSERVVMTIDRAVFQKMLTAKTIEMKIGTLEFKLKEKKQRERLRAFSQAIDNLPAAPAAAAKP